MKTKRHWLAAVGAVLVAAICLSGAKCGAPHITLSYDTSSFTGIALSKVQEELDGNGFSNIETEEVENDIGSKSEETVSLVTIDGEKDVKKGTELSADAPVVIQYYGEYSGSGIAMPEASSAYEGKPASNVVNELEELGFKNVGTATVANDKSEDAKGTVEYISMGGKNSFSKGEAFESDITVIVREYGSYGMSADDSAPADNGEQDQPLQLSTAFPSKTVTCEVQNISGYTIEATINLGYWVKASDSAAVAKAWQQVGGKGNPPEVSQFSKLAKAGESAMTFATISLRNKTPDFNITPENAQSIGLGFIDFDTTLTNKSSDPFGAIGIAQFSVGFEKLTDTSAKMDSNTWGPVPVAYLATNVFIPRYGSDGMGIMQYAVVNILGKSGYVERDIALPVSW